MEGERIVISAVGSEKVGVTARAREKIERTGMSL